MNFKEYYKLGIESAVDIEKKRIEINKVFLKLKTDILEATDGKIEIYLKENYFDLRLEDIIEDYDINCRRIFENNQKSFPKKLAKFITSPDGAYPCNIIFDEDDITIFDINALIDELTKIISSPSVGLIFRNLLDDKLTHPN